MVAALDRKLARDLYQLRGQGLTIALVVASGIASLVALQGTWQSLSASRDAYYDEYRFADLFASLRRAPLSVADELAQLNGVSVVYPRVMGPVRIPLEGEIDPPSGQIVSIPNTGAPPLNRIYLRAGTLPDPSSRHQALLLESFAEAHHIRPGDTIPVVASGRLLRIYITGLAMSPEFVFPPPHGGMFADPERVAVLWMPRDAAAPIFDMEGGFNDVVLRLRPGVSQREIIERVEERLAPYGNSVVVARDKQTSNNILSGEMTQLRQFATVAPAIFLAVAAFLLNVVLSRLVLLQRPEIAALKALGYGNAAIGLHFLKLVLGVVVVGALLGIGLGVWLGLEMTELYTRYFRFPALTYRVSPSTLLTSFAVSLGAAVLGALLSVRQVVKLPPAEAMRPPPPARYRKGLLERLGVTALLGPSARMVMRELTRQPLRLLLSALGISMAVGIMVVGRYSSDALDQLITAQFYSGWREDMVLFFEEPKPQRVLRTLDSFPGVLHAEGARMVAVRFHHEHRWRDAVLMGYPDDLILRRVINASGQPQLIPAGGVMLTRKLAEVLQLEPGEQVEVELREEQRRTVPVLVTALADEAFGLQGYMRLDDLSALLREQPAITVAMLQVDLRDLEPLQQRIQEIHNLRGVLRKVTIIEQFRTQSAETMLIVSTILTVLASTIAVGVVYNNARVALSMRSRELASLRVLGFTRREISAILLGEIAVQIILAIPMGLLFGRILAVGIASAVDPEQYRLPITLSSQTYAFAALVTMVAGLFSALLVRRKLDQLDLIGVLKTRE